MMDSMQKFIDSMGGVREFACSMERFKKDCAYFDNHRQSLLDQYPEEWVIVYNEEVIYHYKSLDKLIKRTDGELRRSAAHQFITTRKRKLILAMS